MTNPELDQVNAQDPAAEPDFAEEHDKPTFADELAGRPGMEPDEASELPDSGGAGWRDQERPLG